MDSGAQLIWMAFWGVIVAAIAHSRGRNAFGWFFIGFLIQCIGLIIVLVIPDLNVERRRDNDQRADRRRLREQLRQERMKNEAYRRHVSARLDVHDEHLGIDTRATTALPEGHGLQQVAPALDGGDGPPPPPVAGSTVKEWFYERGGESRGPVSEVAIRTGLQNGKIDSTTLIWREGMPNWQALGEVPVFATDFRA